MILQTQNVFNKKFQLQITIIENNTLCLHLLLGQVFIDLKTKKIELKFQKR